MKLILSCLLLFSSNAFAAGEFDGFWRGSGAGESQSGWSGECHSEMGMLHSETKIELFDWDITCRPYGSFGWSNIRLVITEDGRLLLRGNEVGQISHDQMNAVIIEGDEVYNSRLEVNSVIVGDRLMVSVDALYIEDGEEPFHLKVSHEFPLH